MIRQLRIRFTAVSLGALAVILALVLGGVNLMSYQRVVRDADEVLAILSADNGAFSVRDAPLQEQVQGQTPPSGNVHGGKGGHGLTRESTDAARYFSVLLDAEGQVLNTNLEHISAVDEQTAGDYALRVWEAGDAAGFYNDYRFAVSATEEGAQVLFLDCESSLSGFRATLLYSVSVAVLGLAAVLVLLLAVSKRIVRPLAESYEKQKRFITDAGHEIKTPLTIISADADLAVMELGENEWLTDIRQQTQRLTGLTNDLIYLSRMDEAQHRLTPIPFPISDMVEEMAQSFQAPARTRGQTLEVRIQPMLSYTGDEKALRQLVSILLDNALKYAPEGGRITLELEKQGRGVRLLVGNTTLQSVTPEMLRQLFDRFYRADPSRSTQTGGYGLGLSIAQSIAAAHGGRLTAQSPDGQSLRITAVLN